VGSGEPTALAAALDQLIRDPQLRRRLGMAGEARVRHDFDMHAGIDQLAERFGLPPLRAAAE
jgi:glycosyltransferase involved in cell wall biosynthesis